MWIENFRQFLNHSLRRFEDWARCLSLPQALRSRRVPESAQKSLLALEGLGLEKAQFSTDEQHADWCVNFSYRYRSLHCQIQVSILEQTSGMLRIYEVLQRSDEA
jgi:hypothetical protein